MGETTHLITDEVRIEYMAAIINNQKTEDGATDFDKLKRYIKAAKNDGIKTTLPDINISGEKFTPNAKDRTIAYGLGLVKGLSNSGIKTVIENRPYSSFEDFLDKVGLKLGKGDMEALIKANAFRNITVAKQSAQFAHYHDRRFTAGKEEYKPLKTVNKTHMAYVLNEGLVEPEYANSKEACLDAINWERFGKSWKEFQNKYCKGTPLDWEMEVLNSHISGDPFEDVVIPDWNRVTYDANGYLGGVVISVKETVVKNGKSKGSKMCFLNLDVKGKIADIVVFSDKYLEFKDMLKSGACVVCKVQKQGDMKGIFKGAMTLDEWLVKTASIQRG